MASPGMGQRQPAAPVPIADVIAGCRHFRINSQPSKRIRQHIGVTIGLFQASAFERVKPNGFHIAFGFWC